MCSEFTHEDLANFRVRYRHVGESRAASDSFSFMVCLSAAAAVACLYDAPPVGRIWRRANARAPIRDRVDTGERSRLRRGSCK